MKIRTVPDTILRKKACAVARVTDAERRLLAEMAEAMYLSQGVGLAAERAKRRDLGDIAGTWKHDPKIDEVLEDQRRIDPDLWR